MVRTLAVFDEERRKGRVNSDIKNRCSVDFSSLWPQHERQKAGADVLNGISVGADPDVLYVTGKLWNRMFKLKLQ